MPRSSWTEPDEDSVDFSEVELPIIVLDWHSLHDGKDVNIERLWFIQKIWESFNVVVWRKPKVFNKKYKEMDKLISEFYDFNLSMLIECSVDRMKRYLKYNRTIMLSSDPGIRAEFKEQAANVFSVEVLIRDFPFLARRRK